MACGKRNAAKHRRLVLAFRVPALQCSKKLLCTLACLPLQALRAELRILERPAGPLPPILHHRNRSVVLRYYRLVWISNSIDPWYPEAHTCVRIYIISKRLRVCACSWP